MSYNRNKLITSRQQGGVLTAIRGECTKLISLLGVDKLVRGR